MTERHEIWTLLDGIQMDIRAANGKLTSLRSLVAGMNLAPEHRVTCPHCGLAFKGPNTLAEHLHVSHDGPIPEHWKRADALIADAREEASA